MEITLSTNFPRYKHGVSHTEVQLPQWQVAKYQEAIRRIKMDEN